MTEQEHERLLEELKEIKKNQRRWFSPGFWPGVILLIIFFIIGLMGAMHD